MVNIRDINGNVIVNVIISKDSVRRYSLGGDDNVVMKFSTDEPFVFDIGTYIDFSEFKDDYPLIWKIGRFELTSKYIPKYNGMTGGFDYEVRFDAHYLKWKNKILKYNPNRNKQYGNSEAAWVLTATPSVFGAIVAQNLEELGYKWYNPETKGWVNYIFTCVEGCDDAKSITLTFANTPILDAISMIAEACNGGEGCDWWIDKNTIYIGRCENGEVIDLSYQTNIATLDIQEGENDYATRIYAFGGTRNIPKGYGKDFNEDVVRAAIVQRNLMLPYYAKGQVPQQIISELKEKYPSIPEYTGQRFVDAESNLSQEQLVEQVVVFEDIYPSQEGEVSELKLETEAEKDTDGNETGETLYHYEFKDVSLKNFKDDYLTEEPLSITFSSGLLNGFTFELEKLSSDGTGTVFYIKVSEDYGQMLPNDVLKPMNGDKFNIFNYDISLVEDDLVGKAEVELLKKAYEYISKSSEDQKTYTITAFSDWSYNNGNVRIFDLGQKVKIDIPSLFGEKGKTSRIISVEYKLDAPYDSPILTVGETKAFSRLKALEGEVGDLAHKGKYYALSGQGGVYVIKSTDPHTPSSEYNVYSALKSEKHFLFKTKEDTAKGHITFEKGITVKESVNLDNQDITGVDVESDVPAGGMADAKDTSVPTTAAMVKHVQEHGDENYLSKVNNDTAKGKITFKEQQQFDKGFEVDNFTPGVADGTGGAFRKEEDGNVHLTTDYLNVRRKARFNDMEILTTHHIGGAQMSSAASCKIDHVVTRVDGVYQCFFRKTNSDGRIITNDWIKGDQAYCNTFNLQKQADGTSGNHYFWRLVVSTDAVTGTLTSGLGETFDASEYHCVWIAMSDCAEGSDDPQAEDEVVLLGHQPQSGETEADYAGRQSAIYQVASGTDGRPYYRQYVGINSFTLDGCLEQQFMPNDNRFKGKVVVTGEGWDGLRNEAGETLGDLSYSATNMLRNTGFYGEGQSADINANTMMNVDTETLSPSLEHWTAVNAQSIADEFSPSGYAVEFNGVDASISQETESVFPKETYIISFQGTPGTEYTISYGGVETKVTAESRRTKVKIVATENPSNTFSISCEISESKVYGLLLERGTVASNNWIRSVYDVNPEIYRLQNLQYLANAIRNGSTTVKGGLILSNIIQLGNFVNGILKQVTSGVSGVFNSYADVALWSGGTFKHAGNTVAKLLNNPFYNPTEEELAEMAKFVVTHGGTAILNEAIVRGTVYATNGIFNGEVNATSGTFVNGKFDNVVINGAYNRLVISITPQNKHEYIYTTNGINHALLLKWGDVVYLDEDYSGEITFPYLEPDYDEGTETLSYMGELGWKIDKGQIVRMEESDVRSLVGRQIAIYGRKINGAGIDINCGMHKEVFASDTQTEVYTISNPYSENTASYNWKNDQAKVASLGLTIATCILAQKHYTNSEGVPSSAEMITWSIQYMPMMSGSVDTALAYFWYKIDGTDEQFDFKFYDGWTWAQFVKSQFNNNGAFAIESDGKVIYVKGENERLDVYEYFGKGESVYADDKIENGKTYSNTYTE